MAQMFPDITKLKGITSINASEIDFYMLLKDSEYTKDWKVFYSAVLKLKNKIQEIDFIIFIPNNGIVLVELKANNPIETSFDRFVYNYNGRNVEKENPFRKIKNNTHNFKDFFNLSAEEKSKIFVSNIIIFPNWEYEFDKKISCGELNYINAKTDWSKIPETIHTYFLSKKNSILRIGSGATEKEINNIMDKICNQIISTTDRRIEAKYENAENAFNNLKNQMLNYSSIFNNFRRVFIDGPASSGKSFFALQYILKNNEDNKIAYIVGSEYHYYYLKHSFQKTNNVDIARYNNYKNEIKKQKYDILMLDDFESFYDSVDVDYLDNIAKDGFKEGNVWILSDTYKKSFNIDDFLINNNFKDFYIKINLNFRNNSMIGSFINRLYEKSVYINYMFEYYDDLILVNFVESNFENDIDEVFFTLRKEKYQSNDIVILTPKKNEESSLKKLLSKKKISKKIDKYNPINSSNYIRYSDIDSFMGLDSNVVILIDIDNTIRDLKTVLYKAASRAKMKLIIFADKSVINEIRRYT